MTDKIKHLGIVESINGSYLKVRIVQTSACSACSIKGHCSAAESKEKLIDVYNKSGLPCQVGNQVMISGATSLGMKAVMWAFVFPFVVLLVSLLSLCILQEGMRPFLPSHLCVCLYLII